MFWNLNCVLILNWIVRHWTVFDIEIILPLNWIVWNRAVFDIKPVYLSSTELFETVYMYKNGVGIINLQWLMYHKTKSNQTKAIIVEGQQWYYFTDSYGDKEIRTFLKDNSPKMTVTARLEFDLAYFDVIVQHVSHSLTCSSPGGWAFSRKNYRLPLAKCKVQIVCDKDGVVDCCIVLVKTPLTRFEEWWPLLTESPPELP